VHDEGDFIDQLAQLSFYDEKNLVREWMEYGRSNRAPVLDEDDDEGDTPLPSHIVTEHITPSDLRTSTGDECISDWARRNVGDTHLGKRKLHVGPTRDNPKRQATGKGKRTIVLSDEDTDDGEGDRSPHYQESQDSSSDDDDDGDDDDDDDDGGDGGAGVIAGAGAGAGGSGGGGSVPPSEPPAALRFTGMNFQMHSCLPLSVLSTNYTIWLIVGETQFTHATQDADHGAPASQRMPFGVTDYGTPEYSSSSYSESSNPYHYPVPELNMQPPMRWVYEWQDPHWYNMILQEWQTTSAWTGQTWQEFKAELLQRQGLNVMSTAEFEMARQYYR
jgi:hypothetical protein